MFIKNSFEPSLFEQWLREKRDVKESTMYLYVLAVTKFISEYDDLENLDNYNKFLIKHSIRKKIYHYYAALKRFIEYKITDISLRHKMTEGLIKIEQNQNKRERKYLEEKEIISIINNLAKTKHQIIAIIQETTGVRAGDVIKIKRGNIIPEIYEGTNVLKIIIYGKGDKQNVIYIHDNNIQTIIIEYIIKNFIDEEYYFMEKRKGKYNDFLEERTYLRNYKLYYKDTKYAIQKAGYNLEDFSTHDYRRCFARRVWTKYKDLHVLQELLNHANPSTTMIYLKTSGLKNIDYHKEMQSR